MSGGKLERKLNKKRALAGCLSFFSPSEQAVLCLISYLIRHVLRAAHQTVLDHRTPLCLPQTVERDQCLVKCGLKAVSPADVTGFLNETSRYRCG